MERYTDSQYDDDLTIGADDYNDSFQTDDVDLFEFGGEEETTISRLKTLVLSIDWEITDEVLLQFNEEILDLKDIWANEKIQMVYLQALEKIGKYIYREKADAHPNAIRLLLSMYYNLERIVLSGELSDAEKKRILLEDVQRFEKLKKLISRAPKAADKEVPAGPVVVEVPEGDAGELRVLKAIVLGIDWEITDNDLLALREEVMQLQEIFADSKPKQIFLQGIGTIGTYIRKKKSNAHADAFTLLHSFYDGLERLVKAPFLTLEQEKEILRPEVQKFNEFKNIIASTLTSGADEDMVEADEEEVTATAGSIAPAFADLPEDGVRGFQEDEEAKALQLETPVNVDQHIARFFGEEEEKAISGPAAIAASQADSIEKEVEDFSDAFFGNGLSEEPPASFDIDRDIALKGVNVETEADDDSDEEALPVIKGEVAPALVGSGEVSAFSEAETPAEAASAEDQLSEEVSGKLDSFFGKEEDAAVDSGVPASFEVPAEIALQGVDVETPEDEEDEDEVAMVLDQPPAEPVPTVTEEPPALEPAVVEPEGLAPAFAEFDQAEEDATFDAGETFEEGMAEEDVEQRFDELFAALPDDETSLQIDRDAEVEDEVEAFFSLEEEPDASLVTDAEPTEDIFDQEILGVREEEPISFTEEPAELTLPGQEAATEPALDQDIVVPPVAAMEETVEEMVEEVVATEAEPLADLRDCVQSLGIELRDDILETMFSHLDSLKERWADRPLELTFLELLTTVGRHVDLYRFGASDQAGALLASVMEDFGQAVADGGEQAPARVLAATGRVLAWQRQLLEQQSMRGEDGFLQLVDGRAIVPAADDKFSFVTEEHQQVQAVEVPELTLDEREIEPVFESEAAGSERIISDIVRREIEILRETLKKEIAELRNRIEG